MKLLTLRLFKTITAIAVCLFASNSVANCLVNEKAHFPTQHGKLSYWQNLIKNSDDTALAMFWDKGNCYISKGPHKGGTPPPTGDGATLHITVEDSFRTCHVFNQQDAELKTLTTCRP
ncbi:hypothetical protein [Pseudoalteromonas mariniglutinosa]|uniref:hypothetical protein n=1 Tax=Pseudoalteromonas mariniglutinosa TaxID=206042 RepID=UPI00384EB34F